VRHGLAATAVAGAALVLLAGLVVAGALNALDQYALDHWMPYLEPRSDHVATVSARQFYPGLGSPLQAFCNIWTYPASAFVSGLVLAVCCVVLLRRRRRSTALAWVTAWVGANVIEVVGKHELRRPPLHTAAWGDYGIFAHAFPSGHALRAVLTAALLAAVWRRAAWPALVWVAVALPALVVSAAHTPTDVLGGVLLGLFAMLAADTWLRSRAPAGQSSPLRFGLRAAFVEDS
jgi:membrane-associated phospholipid phosphatase